MCIRHRCSLWGANKCATRYAFTDPQGSQLDYCTCGCCRVQCAEAKMCANAVPLPLEAEPAPSMAKLAAREAEDGSGVWLSAQHTPRAALASAASALVLVAAAATVLLRRTKALAAALE